MTLDVQAQLRGYSEQLASMMPTIEVEELLEGREPGLPPPRRRLRGVLVAVAAAVAVLLVIGVVVFLRSGIEEPPPVTEPTPTTTPAEDVTPTTLRALPPPGPIPADQWARIPDDGTIFRPGDEITDIALGGPGLVAIGHAVDPNDRQDGTIWLSPDGVIWTRPPLNEEVFGTGGIRLNQIVAFREELLVFGQACDDPDQPCPPVQALWRSIDGLTWERVSADLDDLAITDVTPFESGLVAVGEGFTAWTSADGLTWTRTFVDSDPRANVAAVTAGGPGLVAVGNVCCDARDRIFPAIWISPDGIDWTRVDEQGLEDGQGSLWDVVAGGPGLVAVGTGHPIAQGEQMMVWVSSDGTSWTRVYQDEPGHAGIGEVIAGGPGLVAVGGGREGAAVWISEEGFEWERIAGLDAGLADGFLTAAVAAGPGVVTAGTDSQGTGIWVTPPGELPATPTPTTLPGAAPSLTTEPITAASGWTLQQLPEVFDGFVVQALTAGRTGFVAVGRSPFADELFPECDVPIGPAPVWRSEDAVIWDRVSHEDQLFGETKLNFITAAGPGLVALGDTFICDHEARAQSVVLLSTDGVAWTRIEDPDLRRAVLLDVAEGPAGLVAVGSDLNDPFTRKIWRSTDGTDWTASAAPFQGSATAVEATDALYIVGGVSGGPAPASIWTSTDGISWSRIALGESFSPDDSRHFQPISQLASGPDGIIASNGLAIWHSPDGTSWTGADVTGRFRSVTASDDGFVAAGSVGQGELFEVPAAVWTSSDGLRWELVPQDPTVFPAGVVEHVAIGPSGVAAFGRAGCVLQPDRSVECLPVLWTWTPNS